MVYSLGTCVISTGSSCGPVTAIPTTRCLQATVTCPNGPRGDAIAPLAANLKVSDPTGSVSGTVVMFSGGTGTGFFETLSSGLARDATVQPILNLGLRVIQVGWEGSVFSGSAGALGLMCRPATLLRGIYDDPTIHTQGQPFIMIGQSGGASQISYALAHYGVYDWVTDAVICAGPPHARIDRGTLSNIDTANETLLQSYKVANVTTTYYGGDAQLIDSSYGSQTACQNRTFFGGEGNIAFKDSICNGLASYVYRSTNVTFIYGDSDGSSAIPNGRIYKSLVLAANGSNTVERLTTGGVGHVDLPGSASGSAYIVDAVRAALL